MTEGGLDLAGVEDAYPLTKAQAGMLFHSLAEPHGGVYLGHFSAVLPTRFDLEAFQAAWSAVVARHTALRTQFVWDGLDQPVQVVRDQVEPVWDSLDWRQVPMEQNPAALHELLEQQRREGLNLSRAPLMRLTLIARADGRYRFLWLSHHAICDDLSALRILRETALLYGRDPRGPSRSMPFRHFVDWLATGDQQAAETYWSRELEGFQTPTRLQMPAVEAQGKGPRPSRSLEARLDVETSQRIRTSAAALRVTLNAVVTAAWGIILHRAAGQDDVMFGTAFSHRPHELPDSGDAVGNFVTTLAARVCVDRHSSIRDLVLARHRDGIAASGQGVIGLNDLHRLSGLPAGEPLFESIVALERGELAGALNDTRAVALYGEPVNGDQSNFPLSLLVFADAQIGLRLLYDPGRFDERTAQTLLDMTRNGLAALPRQLDDLPYDLRVLADVPRSAATVPPAAMDPVHVELVARARAHPDSLALVCGDRSLSYGELEHACAQLARRIMEQGVERGARVAIHLETGLDFVIAIFAVLRAGCAYVPLDARHASERLGVIFADSRAALVLTDAARAAALADGMEPVLVLDAPRDPVSDTIALPSVGGDDGAYVIYTSGSTGTPKGVPVSHANLCASTGARSSFYAGSPAVYLLLSSFAFDSSVAGLFWTLCSGGTLVLTPDGAEQDMAALGELISRHRVTHTLCLPSLYDMLLRYTEKDALQSLRVVICAGEALPPGLVARHRERLPKVRLFNEYGPTEATVWCAVADCTDLPSDAPVPIGRAIPGATLLLRDERGRAVPDGLPGELLVGGAGVTAGYLGMPEATAQHFVMDPALPEVRLYRTGDLARRGRADLFELIGRADDQVKLRGHRIEPGEIEAVLARRPDVREALVRARWEGVHAALVAYLVPEPQRWPERDELKAYARRLLPAWMVPSDFVTLNAFPRTANGKINVQALPTPRRALDAAEVTVPRTPLERQLAGIWRRVLWLERDPGVDEDFFALGGHSLLSIQLLNEIESELALRLPMSALARIGTIAEQAETLETTASALAPATESAPVSDDADPFAALTERELRDLHAHMAGWGGQPVLEQSLTRVLNYDGDLSPLFWCFNAAHEFGQMARCLGPRQRLYGMRSGNLVVEMSPEMQQRNNRRVAMHYLRELLRIQPEGPYLLGGNCQGAAIAMELALALQGLGQAVPVVFLMEVVPVQPYQGRVALVFGRDSEFNPHRGFVDPGLGWRRQFADHSYDEIAGGHGQYFDEPNIRDLALVVARRLAEAQRETPFPLPAAACRIDWQIEGRHLGMTPGEPRDLHLKLRNPGPFWWGCSARTGLVLCSRWLDADGEVLARWGQMTEIETDWPPAEQRDMLLRVRAPEIQGNWTLEVDLVEQGRTRFSDRGGQALRFDVRVEAARVFGIF